MSQRSTINRDSLTAIRERTRQRHQGNDDKIINLQIHSMENRSPWDTGQGFLEKSVIYHLQPKQQQKGHGQDASDILREFSKSNRKPMNDITNNSRLNPKIVPQSLDQLLGKSTHRNTQTLQIGQSDSDRNIDSLAFKTSNVSLPKAWLNREPQKYQFDPKALFNGDLAKIEDNLWTQRNSTLKTAQTTGRSGVGLFQQDGNSLKRLESNDSSKILKNSKGLQHSIIDRQTNLLGTEERHVSVIIRQEPFMQKKIKKGMTHQSDLMYDNNQRQKQKAMAQQIQLIGSQNSSPIHSHLNDLRKQVQLTESITSRNVYPNDLKIRISNLRSAIQTKAQPSVPLIEIPNHKRQVFLSNDTRERLISAESSQNHQEFDLRSARMRSEPYDNRQYQQHKPYLTANNIYDQSLQPELNQGPLSSSRTLNQLLEAQAQSNLSVSPQVDEGPDVHEELIQFRQELHVPAPFEKPQWSTNNRIRQAVKVIDSQFYSDNEQNSVQETNHLIKNKDNQKQIKLFVKRDASQPLLQNLSESAQREQSMYENTALSSQRLHQPQKLDMQIQNEVNSATEKQQPSHRYEKAQQKPEIPKLALNHEAEELPQKKPHIKQDRYSDKAFQRFTEAGSDPARQDKQHVNATPDIASLWQQSKKIHNPISTTDVSAIVSDPQEDTPLKYSQLSDSQSTVLREVSLIAALLDQLKSIAKPSTPRQAIITQLESYRQQIIQKYTTNPVGQSINEWSRPDTVQNIIYHDLIKEQVKIEPSDMENDVVPDWNRSQKEQLLEQFGQTWQDQNSSSISVCVDTQEPVFTTPLKSNGLSNFKSAWEELMHLHQQNINILSPPTRMMSSQEKAKRFDKNEPDTEGQNVNGTSGLIEERFSNQNCDGLRQAEQSVQDFQEEAPMASLISITDSSVCPTSGERREQLSTQQNICQQSLRTDLPQQNHVIKEVASPKDPDLWKDMLDRDIVKPMSLGSDSCAEERQNVSNSEPFDQARKVIQSKQENELSEAITSHSIKNFHQVSQNLTQIGQRSPEKHESAKDCLSALGDSLGEQRMTVSAKPSGMSVLEKLKQMRQCTANSNQLQLDGLISKKQEQPAIDAQFNRLSTLLPQTTPGQSEPINEEHLTLKTISNPSCHNMQRECGKSDDIRESDGNPRSQNIIVISQEKWKTQLDIPDLEAKGNPKASNEGKNQSLSNNNFPMMMPQPNQTEQNIHCPSISEKPTHDCERSRPSAQTPCFEANSHNLQSETPQPIPEIPTSPTQAQDSIKTQIFQKVLSLCSAEILQLCNIKPACSPEQSIIFEINNNDHNITNGQKWEMDKGNQSLANEPEGDKLNISSQFQDQANTYSIHITANKQDDSLSLAEFEEQFFKNQNDLQQLFEHRQQLQQEYLTLLHDTRTNPQNIEGLANSQNDVTDQAFGGRTSLSNIIPSSNSNIGLEKNNLEQLQQQIQSKNVDGKDQQSNDRLAPNLKIRSPSSSDDRGLEADKSIATKTVAQQIESDNKFCPTSLSKTKAVESNRQNNQGHRVKQDTLTGFEFPVSSEKKSQSREISNVISIDRQHDQPLAHNQCSSLSQQEIDFSTKQRLDEQSQNKNFDYSQAEFGALEKENMNPLTRIPFQPEQTVIVQHFVTTSSATILLNQDVIPRCHIPVNSLGSCETKYKESNDQKANDSFSNKTTSQELLRTSLSQPSLNNGNRKSNIIVKAREMISSMDENIKESESSSLEQASTQQESEPHVPQATDKRPLAKSWREISFNEQNAETFQVPDSPVRLASIDQVEKQGQRQKTQQLSLKGQGSQGADLVRRQKQKRQQMTYNEYCKQMEKCRVIGQSFHQPATQPRDNLIDQQMRLARSASTKENLIPVAEDGEQINLTAQHQDENEIKVNMRDLRIFAHNNID